MLFGIFRTKTNKPESKDTKRIRNEFSLEDKDVKKKGETHQETVGARESGSEEERIALASSLLTEMNNPERLESDKQFAVLEPVQTDNPIKGVITVGKDTDKPEQLLKGVITAKTDEDKPDQPAKAMAVPGGNPEKPEASKSALDDLFKEDESISDTPMRRFVNALPVITCRELTEDIRRVSEMLVRARDSCGGKQDKGGV